MTVVVSVRFTAAEVEQLRKRGGTLSEVMRRAVREVLATPTVEISGPWTLDPRGVPVMCLLGCGPSGDNPVWHLETVHPGLVDADPFDRWPDGQLAPADHTLQPGDFQEPV